MADIALNDCDGSSEPEDMVWALYVRGYHAIAEELKTHGKSLGYFPEKHICPTCRSQWLKPSESCPNCART